LFPQLIAYLRDDPWLQNARHANACTATFSQGLAALGAGGVGFHRWGPGNGAAGGTDGGRARFVCAFNTEQGAVDRAPQIAQDAV